ncbi:hypothetical protein PHSY_005142 [Pseudozyma hubeiensis SY62]|uniref:Uncharacterized protein n=1 Tax=Pseudozyma hubeiensis (strain SY62) TaxID=1305764 RepID=R9P861_PSEHS|nr:hypothetical protein PHSY_005142 [Pseudozyma hubeiensis SY62]GAC97556.1 hypothetical protein PHSY_005142 [Pseudozyma hubeiensis SY62]
MVESRRIDSADRLYRVVAASLLSSLKIDLTDLLAPTSPFLPVFLYPKVRQASGSSRRPLLSSRLTFLDQRLNTKRGFIDIEAAAPALFNTARAVRNHAYNAVIGEIGEIETAPIGSKFRC